MRIGYAIAVVALIVAAALFAPRAGPPEEKPAPVTPEPAPELPAEKPPGPVLRDLEEIYALLPETDPADTFANEALRELWKMKDLKRRWVTPEEFERASALLDRTLEHEQKLKKDRSYREMWRFRTNLRLHPVFRGRELVVAHQAPWVVVTPDGEEEDHAFAKKVAGWLAQLSERFRKEFGFPPISEAPRESERILKFFVFRTEKTFSEFFVKIGQPLMRGTLSVYRPSDQWAVTYRPKSGKEKDEVRQLLFPAVHQLTHFHTKLAMQRKKPGKEVSFTHRRVHRQLLWCSEGLVHLFSNVTFGTDGQLEFFRFDPELLEPLVRKPEHEGDDWPFHDLIKIPNRGVMRRRSREIGLHPMAAGRLTERFGAFSYALVYYFWSHESEGIRTKFRAYLNAEFEGRSGYKHWKKALGKTDDDWSELERDFRAWLETRLTKK